MSRGGKRKGAGRPKSPNGATKPVRLPIELIASIKQFIDNKNAFKLPLYSSKVPAGHPSTADDHVEAHIDLNDLVKHPKATFLVKVSGNSMIDAGINENDMLIVDRSIPTTHGKIVIASVQGQLTVKRIHFKDGQLALMPANDDYQPIKITEDDDIHIWGVVTKVIHDV